MIVELLLGTTIERTDVFAGERTRRKYAPPQKNVKGRFADTLPIL